MKLFKYSEYITEGKLELLLEANMQFSEDFLAVVAKVKSPISEKILKLYKTDVDVDTNYIDVSDKENFLEFKSDRRVETACVINRPGEIYDVLSKNLFPSFASIYNDQDGPYGETFRDYIDVDQTARIVKQLTSDDDRLSPSLRSQIDRGQSLYHIQWNFSGKNYECIIAGSGIRKGEKGVKPQEVRVGSLIQSLLKKSGEEVDGSELEDFVVKFNSEVKSRKENIFRDFQIVKGEDIRTYYLYSSYESDEHTLGSSCMRHGRCQDYLDIYVKNPNQVSMVVLFSEKNPDKIRGRAILWTNPKYGLRDLMFPKPGAKSSITQYEGKPFMDRIYINNSPDTELFKKFAKKNGFIYKKDQDYSKTGFMLGDEITEIQKIEVKIENTSFDQYPYVDTLTYYTPWSGKLNNQGGEYELNETDGGNGQECGRCDGEERVDCPECNYEGRVDCENCDGNGDNECHECDGDGRVSCSSCEGSETETCSSCDGSGEDEEGNECSNCEGSGNMTCTECDGSGKEDCFNCSGDGRRECPECDGAGSVTCGECDGDSRVDCPECQ
jgi:hypothetical protein